MVNTDDFIPGNSSMLLLAILTYCTSALKMEEGGGGGGGIGKETIVIIYVTSERIHSKLFVEHLPTESSGDGDHEKTGVELPREL